MWILLFLKLVYSEEVLNANYIKWLSDSEWRATKLSKFNKNDMKHKGQQWCYPHRIVFISAYRDKL